MWKDSKTLQNAILPILQLTRSLNRKRTRIRSRNYAESEQNRHFPYKIKKFPGSVPIRYCQFI